MCKILNLFIVITATYQQLKFKYFIFSGSVQLRSDSARARVALSPSDQLELAADRDDADSFFRKPEKSRNENETGNGRRIQRKVKEKTCCGQSWRKSSSSGELHSVLSSVSCKNSLLELDKSRESIDFLLCISVCFVTLIYFFIVW